MAWSFATLTCSRNDAAYVLRKTERGCFHKGGNSSLRHHLRQHWALYKKTCEEKGVAIRDSAMPTAVLKAKQEAAAAAEAGKDPEAGKLTSMGFTPVIPQEFSVQGALEHISKYIVCTDQVCVNPESIVPHLRPI